MEQLIRNIQNHLQGKQEQLLTLERDEFQCEGWFKAELLTFLHCNGGENNIQSYEREVKHDSLGRKRIDLKISVGQDTHWIELKHWLLGRQRQNNWTAKGYFGDQHNGIYNDVSKLSLLPDHNRWLLIFISRKPTIDEWNAGIKRFNEKFDPLWISSVIGPINGTERFSCGLLRVEPLKPRGSSTPDQTKSSSTRVFSS